MCSTQDFLVTGHLDRKPRVFTWIQDTDFLPNLSCKVALLSRTSTKKFTKANIYIFGSTKHSMCLGQVVLLLALRGVGSWTVCAMVLITYKATLQLRVQTVRTGVQPALEKVTLNPTITVTFALEASTLTIGLYEAYSNTYISEKTKQLKYYLQRSWCDWFTPWV